MTNINKNYKYCCKNVLFIVSSSWLIFTNVRQGAPGKILPRAANWPGPALFTRTHSLIQTRIA